MIEETAELVTRLGGVGIAIAVDHLDADQVQTLAEQIRNEHGRVDVLVSDIWGGERLKDGPTDGNTPIWNQRRVGRNLAISVEPLRELTAEQRRQLDDEVELVGARLWRPSQR